MLIAEATDISPRTRGYEGAPGLYSDEQQATWQQIVESVHQAGAKMAVQLWHCGVISHADLLENGTAPISASADNVKGVRTSLRNADGSVRRVSTTPAREATVADIQQVIKDFADRTRRAKAVGFDFVEIHGAHGYLLGQLFSPNSNHRMDNYGGSRENRARLMLEVIDACVAAWDKNHIGIRISPMGSFNNVDMGYDEEEALWLIEQIQKRSIAFLHLSEPDWADGQPYTVDFRQKVRERFRQTIICTGAYTAEKADSLIAEGLMDAVAFGRAFLANSDLPERIAKGAELNPMKTIGVYGGGAEGYTDYPRLVDQ
ncbi:N-ethylmaleimide reductase [Oligella sp. MSHR50489EDL]|uniref:N-ethylmaleimide reductase n=1 Tax=Oligella sp. MSHR50489EDL TaxID=3139409 RepID=UPI003D819B4D